MSQTDQTKSSSDTPDSGPSTMPTTDLPHSDPVTQDVPRVINEDTDLSTLTDQEIMRLMESMDRQPVDIVKVCFLPNTISSCTTHLPSLTQSLIVDRVAHASPLSASHQCTCTSLGHTRRVQTRFRSSTKEVRLVTGAWMGSSLACKRRW
jgi:hypothetical protein